MKVAKVKDDQAFIKKVIDDMVRASGLPVTLSSLRSSGLATREQLRRMERRGILKSVMVNAGGTYMTAYYSEDALPEFEKERRGITHGTEVNKHEENGDREAVKEASDRAVQEVHEKARSFRSRDEEAHESAS